LKMALELNPKNEIGFWTSIPDHGDSAVLGNQQNGFSLNVFEPISQTNFFWRHCWDNRATTNAWIGAAEEPGEMVFGADAQIPLGDRLSLFGGFNYIHPSASGVAGQDEEMWNLSMGIVITAGCRGANRCRLGGFGPFLPLADNGSLAVRRR